MSIFSSKRRRSRETSQWALFLRNHDELTLEMVTDEERDYMYRVYANDAKARINLGIRRRLAPLLGNDRKRIELLNLLLLSLPGTPVLYYGDEIGMGDNVFLGDRNGVRTPMQWSSDRNAGFSRASPQALYLPIILDPEYHYEADERRGAATQLRIRCSGGCKRDPHVAQTLQGVRPGLAPVPAARQIARCSCFSANSRTIQSWSSPISRAFPTAGRIGPLRI